MNRSIFTIACFLAAFQFAKAETFLENLYPAGVHMDMTLDELRSAREQAIDGPALPGGGVSLFERLAPLTFGWYYVKQGKLAGYMRITRASQLDSKQREEEAVLINPEKSGEFIRNGTSQAARSTKELQMEIIDVVNWKSKVSDLQLYSVDSPNELTVIVFEPSRLSWKDFFVGPEIKSKLEAERKRIAAVLDDNSVQKQSALKPVAQASPAPKLSSPTPATIVEAKELSNSFPIIPVAILAAVIVGVAVFLWRRNS